MPDGARAQLGSDLPSAVREIRDRREHVKVVGSLDRRHAELDPLPHRGAHSW